MATTHNTKVLGEKNVCLVSSGRGKATVGHVNFIWATKENQMGPSYSGREAHILQIFKSMLCLVML